MLPIESIVGEIVSTLRASSRLVLEAPTGSGKTTRVPVALWEAGFAKEGQIVVLEPRRLAARMAARRMAEQMAEQVGQTVGYQVRFERKVSAQTKILVVTEGIYLRMVQEDPFLDGVAMVIFDEFHERSIQADVALAMTCKVQREVRPDLRIAVMSATLATQMLSKYLEQCPILRSEGRLFPVQIEYLDAPDSRPLAQQIMAGVVKVAKQTTGDILAFLPGVGEIRQAQEALALWAERNDVALLPLFADLTPAQQDAVLMPGPRKKVILATNVAQTSITIEGIGAVVDCGLMKQQRLDASVGLNRLELVRISKASAMQRSGRAGRLGPGLCLRLWTAAEHQALPEQDSPEIFNVELSETVLSLLAWGESDLSAFPWFERPATPALLQALSVLSQLGAIANWQAESTVAHLNALGQQMARFPLHPRLTRLLLAGAEYHCLESAALLAALLHERDPFLRSSDVSIAADGADTLADVALRLEILEAFGRDSRSRESHSLLKTGAARVVLQAQQQLLREFQEMATQDANVEKGTTKTSQSTMPPREERIGRAVLAAFPDRLVRRREGAEARGLMVASRGVRLYGKSAHLPALCVCLALDAGRRGERAEAIIAQYLTIEESWLPAHGLIQREEVEFDRERRRVMAFSRTYWMDLMLRESIVTSPDRAMATQLLIDTIAGESGSSGYMEEALGLENPELATWLARVRCLAEWMPELELPAFDLEGLKSYLPMICEGKRSFDEVRRAPLLDILKGYLTYPQLSAIDREAPERIEVPSGSQIRLQYEEGKPPVLAVRIQELFGWLETPTIAGGRVAVLMHLLAPSMRPQQITQDLRSFWENTYPEVRKELRQRYPKHAWPEDPWNATPERRPTRKRTQ